MDPCTGNVFQYLHVFKYLYIHKYNDLSFDTLTHDVESDKNIQLKIQAMWYLYVNAEEDIPTNSPEHRGNPIQMNIFFNSDHAGDRIMRIPNHVIIMYLNSAPIYWYYNRYITVKRSNFGLYFWYLHHIGISHIDEVKAMYDWNI